MTLGWLAARVNIVGIPFRAPIKVGPYTIFLLQRVTLLLQLSARFRGGDLSLCVCV